MPLPLIALLLGITSRATATSYVFLQKFPLQNTFNRIFHTEVLVCEKDGFSVEDLCDASHPKCWSDWAGTDYNPLTNNCNTFTSTILACIFGLSENKPNLGPSDMVTVTCDKCPHRRQEFDKTLGVNMLDE